MSLGITINRFADLKNLYIDILHDTIRPWMSISRNSSFLAAILDAILNYVIYQGNHWSKRSTFMLSRFSDRKNLHFDMLYYQIGHEIEILLKNPFSGGHLEFLKTLNDASWPSFSFVIYGPSPNKINHNLLGGYFCKVALKIRVWLLD